MSEATVKSKVKPRWRSPEYPSVSLKVAVERAQELYGKETFNWANSSVAMGHWGFAPNSSGGARLLAALRHYGLLEDQGDKEKRAVRLTELAKKILRDPRPNSPEKEAALREAALKPGMYGKVWKKWGLPFPSDAQMTYDLENDFGFNPNSIPGFIADYKATLRFSGLDKGDPNTDVAGDKNINKADPASESATLGVGVQQQQNVDTTSRVENYKIPLPKGATAVLSVPVPMPAAAFDMIEGWLKLVRPMMVTEEPKDGEPAA